MEGEELGTMLTISGSKVEGQEAVSCPKGSSFSVPQAVIDRYPHIAAGMQGCGRRAMAFWSKMPRWGGSIR